MHIRKSIKNLVLIVICTFSVLNPNYIEYGNFRNNPTDSPSSSMITSLFSPYTINLGGIDNQKINFEVDENKEYYNVDGLNYQLFNFNMTDSYNYITVKFWDNDFYDYEDASHSDKIFEKKIIQSTSRIITRQLTTEPLFYYFTIEKDIDSSKPSEKSELTVYNECPLLENNITYNGTFSYDTPTVFKFEVIKDYKYNVTCNQTYSSALEFEFIYGEDAPIIDDLYETILYNNGQFTAKTNATAFLMIHSYYEGTFNFNYTITNTPAPQIIKPSISGYYALLILIPIIGVIVVIRRKKISKS